MILVSCYLNKEIIVNTAAIIIAIVTSHPRIETIFEFACSPMMLFLLEMTKIHTRMTGAISPFATAE